MSGAHSVEGSRRTSRDKVAHGAPPDSLAADIIAVFTLTVSLVGFAAPLAVLIFSGSHESGMSRAIGSFIVGTGVIAILVGRRSQIVPVAAFVQEGPALAMAVVAADFMTREGTEIADVFVLLVVTMLAAAVVTGLLGHFGLGELGRYMPTAVVAAFVGGTGWLLVKGGFDVMTHSNLGLTDLAGLSNPDTAKFWVPGLVIGVAAWLVSRSHRAPGYLLGLVVIAGLAGFYIVVALASSVSAIKAGGWLLGPFPETGGSPWVSPDEFRNANWSGIAMTIPGIASVVALTSINQLLNLTSLRSGLAPRLDLDDELRTGAVGNLGAALFGITPGFHGLGETVLLNRLGATRRAVPIISGGLTAVFGLVGVAAVGYVPRLIIGALLVMVGLLLLDDWIEDLVQSVSTAEQVLGVVIMGVVAWFGLLQGVGLGLIAACAIFVVRYSRLDPVRSATSGGHVRSRSNAASNADSVPRAADDRLVVIELQGYVFFGSLATLEDRVRAALDAHPVETLVLDFTNVTGIDASGSQLVARLLHSLAPTGIVARICAADLESRRALLAAEPDLATHVGFFSKVEGALQPAECPPWRSPIAVREPTIELEFHTELPPHRIPAFVGSTPFTSALTTTSHCGGQRHPSFAAGLKGGVEASVM